MRKKTSKIGICGGDIITPKQNKALQCLLTEPTKKAAAKAAGIDERTLRNYLATPEFEAEYNKAVSAFIVDATRQAQQALSPALSTLREIVVDKGENATTRVSAARSLLEYTLKLTERVDILNKIKELERLMEERDG